MSRIALLPIIVRHLPPDCGGLRVALSGGMDSMVLLHALCAVRAEREIHLEAMHIHHGRQPAADEWAQFCRDVCADYGVSIRVEQVQIARRPAGGFEAAARRARYLALATELPAGHLIATAHHQDDQAETLLLQLLRGAGVDGLAAMPVLGPCAGSAHVRLWRPLLGVPRSDIRHYADQYGLSWRDDPSNVDTAFDRNYLRHTVLPQLRLRWPTLSSTLARSAAACADAAAATAALADQDLAAVRSGGHAMVSIAALSILPDFRRRYALRAWIAQSGLPAPEARHLLELEATVVAARSDAAPLLRWPGAEIRRYRDGLYAMPPLPSPPGPETVLCWTGAHPLSLPPGCGDLLMRDSTHRVVPATFSVRFRRGGERIRLSAGEPSRALKTLLQSAGVPPWVRRRMPLIYAGEVLVSVAGWWTVVAYRLPDGDSLFHWIGGPPGRAEFGHEPA